MLGVLKMLPGVFRLIPREVWYVLFAALLYRGAMSWHEHKVEAYGSGKFMAGYNKAVSDGKQLQAQAEVMAAQISSKLKDENNETLRAIDRLGDDLRLRGPGKAVCAYPAPTGAAASGRDAAGGKPDAAMDSMPDREGVALIGVPFDDLVTFGENHDANRSEVLTWRKNDREQREARDKLERKPH